MGETGCRWRAHGQVPHQPQGSRTVGHRWHWWHLSPGNVIRGGVNEGWIDSPTIHLLECQVPEVPPLSEEIMTKTNPGLSDPFKSASDKLKKISSGPYYTPNWKTFSSAPKTFSVPTSFKSPGASGHPPRSTRTRSRTPRCPRRTRSSATSADDDGPAAPDSSDAVGESGRGRP